MTEIRLITNADDFGLSREVNAAVVNAHRFGTLTSCSLMTAEPASSEAISLARSHPELSVGIHLVTAKGRALLPHREIPSIVGRDGRFSSDPAAAGLKYFFSPKARRDLKKELSAQVEAFLSAGLEPTHLDSHLHMHIHPVIFDIALQLAGQYGIPCMRVPRDDLRQALKADRTRMHEKLATAAVFRCFTRPMKKTMSTRGLRFSRRVYGLFMTGKMTETYVLAVLRDLEPGTSELYFHPALHAPIQSSNHESTQCRKEYDILMSGALKRRIEELGIHLVGYRELERKP